MRDKINELALNAAKIPDHKVRFLSGTCDEENNKAIYYYQVDDEEVKVTVEKVEGVIPYQKTFQSTSKHYSLFGKENIPDRYIFKLIHWLVNRKTEWLNK